MTYVMNKGCAIHYETRGPLEGQPIVLIAGMGEQIGSVEYPDEQCEQFVRAGYRVILMDSRDCGLSVPMPDYPCVDVLATLAAARAGVPVSCPYTLPDMADDVAAVLDDLKVERVDVAGASLGGFVARWVALRHPKRVRSLTVVMSGSGGQVEDRQAGKERLGALLQMTVRRDRNAAIEQGVADWRWMWADRFDFDEAWVRARIAYAFDRSYRPEGMGRAILAVGVSPDLFEAQKAISSPTLIIHGSADPVFAPEQARHMQQQIRNSELWLVEDMGHSMPREIWPEMVRRIAELGVST
ncbi:alpha/beta hydrolase [Variovorax sp. J22P271]|uniref:alpha/beta fold hydrolase n=1 Tax=Variovorax davisae TaxID=3053515 RepID=UPI0025772322|nr:alpha/beta hydrolase [Variovorax sp. J22P271]MDM0036726.1 alpha/beta hydrolase [Variovorax sp. J22P271]